MSDTEYVGNVTLTECLKALALSLSEEKHVSNTTRETASHLHKCLLLMEEADQDIVVTHSSDPVM